MESDSTSTSSDEEKTDDNVLDLADLLWHKMKKEPQCKQQLKTPVKSEVQDKKQACESHSRLDSSSSNSDYKLKLPTFSFNVKKPVQNKNQKSEEETKPSTFIFSSPLKSLYETGKGPKDVDKLFKRVTAPCQTQWQRKKEAKLQRSQWSLGKEQWGSMRMTELTEERKQDLMVLNMRSTIDPTRHYKHGDVKTPKFFQLGVVVKDTFHHDHVPKKKRKSLVEELMADEDFKRKLKKQYHEIADIKSKRKAVFQGKPPQKIKRAKKKK